MVEMTTVAGTAATMTEISASSAERLAALRQPSTTKKRSKPADTAKVLATGISTTALFGIVAVMGWQTNMGTAQASASITPTTLSVPPTIQTAPPVAVTPSVAPLVPVAPATVPTTIPVAVPTTQPLVQTPTVRVPSNTTTKASG
jgi:hypothetical protein